MKERPILFSTPMIKAILEGRKVTTRRVMKPQPHLGRYGNGEIIRDDYFVLGDIPLTEDCRYRWIETCPYGKIGDKLWVRESAFISGKKFTDSRTMAYDHIESPETCRRDKDGDYRYVSYCADLANGDSEYARDYGIKITPSIFMPRWASRITLEITDIRVERLNDITEEDAKAEGVDYIPDAPAALSHRTSFAGLWDKINGKTHPWKSNPFCWAISFRKILESEQNGK